MSEDIQVTGARGNGRVGVSLHPVGTATGCPLTEHGREHDIDWVRSDTAYLYGTARALQDVALTVTLARCRSCGTPLLMLGTDVDAYAASLVTELDGVRVSTA